MQDAAFICGRDLHRQIALRDLVGNGVEKLRLPAQLGQDATREPPANQPQSNGQGQRNSTSFKHTAHEGRLHRVDIDPGTNNPAPRRETFHKRNLGHRIRAPRLGPQIVDKASAAFLYRVDKFHKKKLARGILVATEVLALQLGADGMHHHGWMHVVDPKILGVTVAQRAHRFLGTLLGLIFCHGSLARLLMKMGNHAIGGLHRLANAALPLLPDQTALGHHKDTREHQHGQQGKPHEPRETPRNTELFECGHGTPSMVQLQWTL